MADPTLTISIDRASLSLSPLEFSGSNDGTDLVIVSYVPPSLINQVEYMADSSDVHGAEAVAAHYLQGVLAFSWYRNSAASETVVQSAFAEVAAAIGQFSFEIETQVSGAPVQTWRADPGSLTGDSNGRTYVDLSTLTPVYSVSIPVHPIPEA